MSKWMYKTDTYELPKDLRAYMIVGIIASLAVIFTGCMTAVAYSPPVGIPNPAEYWGGTIDPIDDPVPSRSMKCSNWPNEDSNCFYIDNSNSCVNSGQGSPNSPLCNIPDGITMSAGQYMEIHGGIYNDNDSINITANGTADNGVWIVGVGSPVLRASGDNSALSIAGSYYIVDGIGFDQNEQGLSFEYPSSHGCYRNSTIIAEGTLATNGSQIGISGDSSGQHISHIVVYNVTMSNIGDYTTVSSADTHGIKIRNDADYVWVLDSEIFRTQGDSVQTGEANLTGQDFPTYVFIGGNSFYENKENGIDVKSGSDMIFSENRIYNHANEYGSDDSGAGIVIHDDPAPNYIWNINNILYNNHIGIISTQGTNIFMIGNRIYSHVNRPDGAGTCYGQGVGIHYRNSGASGAIVNNSLYNNDVGIQIAQGNGVEIVNNIITGRTFADPEDAWDIAVCDVSGQSADYNQVYSQDDTVKIYWDTNYTTVQAFSSGSAQCSHCQEGNPLLVNPVSDFSVPPTSPVVEKGIEHQAYTDFSNRYSWKNNTISTDYQGNTRPQDLLWDIGAFEYSVYSSPSSGNILFFLPAFVNQEK